ncbi:MAG TPA: DUF692 domain-containing protein [Candidatus Binatia bacterium]|nr:DUF692 domain-containing protein [Candidatus Binatia bacterium]
MSAWPQLGFGAGLRAEHYDHVLGAPGRLDWFEAISENYIDSHGRPLATLEKVRRDHPIALHGVALSIGSADPLDAEYLRRLRALCDRIEPAIVSDHLCWTGVDHTPLYDLLPLPYTAEVLAYAAERIALVQEALGRAIALENPSRYLDHRCSVIPEEEFLAELSRRSGCGILLDVNNVYVSCTNLGLDARRYLDAVPAPAVAQIHLAGFTDKGTHLFDTHGAPVAEPVWELYRQAVDRFGPVATMVEWDSDIPSFERLCAEVDRARAIAEQARASIAA